ncbi:MAG: 6-pyruvoyl-tetrahydropterin synthase-related protein [Planctomycetota bacterium]|nr:6-pyruvoyl-tetrahydropterin synthase-related protein [Planctomycetota bacterium]
MAAAVAPELLLDCPDQNDSAFHIALASRAKEALLQGESPADFWLPDVGLGFPLFRHYQHLPHLALAVPASLFGGHLSIEAFYRVSLGALLALFPISIYLAQRRMGFVPIVAAASALIAPLLSTPNLFGLGFESYVWGGHGLYAQLFATVLAPLAIAESYRVVRSGRGYALASALLAATFCSQLIYGYMLALSTLAFVLLSRGRRAKRSIRLCVLLGTTFLLGSYFFVPAILDSAFANRSVWEPQHKWDSLGAGKILLHCVTGDLFDYGRRPIITVLVGLGLLYAMRFGGERLRIIAALFLAWLALYFGRATWGVLVDILPFSHYIPMHRFIGAVHLFAIPLAGCALGVLLRLIIFRQTGFWKVAAGVVVALALMPAIVERLAYLEQSRAWKRDAMESITADENLPRLISRLGELQGGRVYVGIPGRADEYLKVGIVPLAALCLQEGIDTLGYLWIGITFAGDVQVWFNPDSEAHCRIFGVRYLVFAETRAPPSFARPIDKIGPYSIYEVPSASYFDVVDVPFAVRCTEKTVYSVGHAWIQSELPEKNVHPALSIRHAFGGDLPEITLDPEHPSDTLNEAVGLSVDAGRVIRANDHWTCEVEIERPSVVLFRSNYHPGIRATVDGVDARVFPVTPGFAAAEVTSGHHQIQFAYRPATRWPWYLAGATALLLAGPLARKAERRIARWQNSAPGFRR